MTTSDTVVVTRGLRKTFESEGAPVRALRGVDVSVGTGEFVAVMGPSGCGKSTLLNIIAGLDTPTDGDVVLAGEELVGKTEDELAILRRRHIGIVFQFFNLLEGMSVLENVTLPAVIAGAPRKRGETRARAITETDFRADLQKIRVSTLVIHGDKDASNPLPLTGKRTAALIPCAKLVVYEAAPHGLPFTHTQQLNEDLIRFLRA